MISTERKKGALIDENANVQCCKKLKHSAHSSKGIITIKQSAFKRTFYGSTALTPESLDLRSPVEADVIMPSIGPELLNCLREHRTHRNRLFMSRASSLAELGMCRAARGDTRTISKVILSDEEDNPPW